MSKTCANVFLPQLIMCDSTNKRFLQFYVVHATLLPSPATRPFTTTRTHLYRTRSTPPLHPSNPSALAQPVQLHHRPYPQTDHKFTILAYARARRACTTLPFPPPPDRPEHLNSRRASPSYPMFSLSVSKSSISGSLCKAHGSFSFTAACDGKSTASLARVSAPSPAAPSALDPSSLSS